MECDSEPAIKKPRNKPKVVKEWDEDDIFKLIAMVECEPCLWNAGEEQYHNKCSRDIAWRNISDKFEGKYVPADLTAKWTNLRIQYRDYAGRSKTKSGQGAVQQPKWKFFNSMGFVGRAEEQQTQPTRSNLLIEIQSDSNSLDDSFLTTPPLSTPPLSTPRRSQAPTSSSAATQIAETMREAVVAMKERNQNYLDPNTSFANYLVSELKTLSDEEASAIRKILMIFFLECVEEKRKDII